MCVCLLSVDLRQPLGRYVPVTHQELKAVYTKLYATLHHDQSQGTRWSEWHCLGTIASFQVQVPIWVTLFLSLCVSPFCNWSPFFTVPSSHLRGTFPSLYVCVCVCVFTLDLVWFLSDLIFICLFVYLYVYLYFHVLVFVSWFWG